jgi:putative ATPase
LAIAEGESIQQRVRTFTIKGDAHLILLAHLLKVCIASDPDAAMYWLARMVYAGRDQGLYLENGYFLLGRDIGNA